MLNNEERLEKLKSLGNETVTQVNTIAREQHQSPLAFVVPTEFVELPSKGQYYPENHPLYGNPVVEIKQMTTKEEDILTNKSLIKKGLVIDRLLESLILDKNITSTSLLIGDRNAILLAARRTGYGEDYEINITCPSCESKRAHTINLTEFLETNYESLEEKLQNLDPDVVGRLPNGNIVIKLPKTGWIVECRLLTGKDELYLINLSDSKKKSSLAEDVTIVEQMSLMIESIQLVKDRQEILAAIRSMPASDAKFLRKTYQDSTPSFDMKTKIDCPKCSLEQDLEVGFNQEFFWPKR